MSKRAFPSHKTITSKKRIKGKKNIPIKQREEMKYLIMPRLKFGDSYEEIIERLEDHGYEISISTLKTLKKEMRNELTNRFEEIAQFELIQEHCNSIEIMKWMSNNLMIKLETENISDDTRIRMMNEVRNIRCQLTDLYGSSELVKNVTNYFNKISGK